MINKLILTAFVMMALMIHAAVSEAGSKWEMSIKAKLNSAENTLVIGQSPDARDGIDGIHDVPALLSGDIAAYVELEGYEYWKNIQGECTAPCSTIWNIFIEAETLGQTIELSWDPEGVPDSISMTLTDRATGNTVDMGSQQHISFENTGEREFIIEVHR
jgi:hypothetical protein